jgi:hypothetical protein
VGEPGRRRDEDSGAAHHQQRGAKSGRSPTTVIGTCSAHIATLEPANGHGFGESHVLVPVEIGPLMTGEGWTL